MKAPSGPKGRQSAVETAPFKLKIEPFGPSPDDIRAVAQAVSSHKAVQALLGKARSRLLRIDMVEPPEETKPARPKPPDKFRATFYDYTNNRAIIATGSIAKPAALEVTESGHQPPPNSEEFDE